MFQARIRQLSAILIWAASMLIWAPPALSELADRDKPINLEADQVTVDDAKNISTFIGNVRLSQGSLLILGDEIVVEQDKEGYLMVTAHGKTASFRQKREGFDSYIEGYGEHIEYDARNGEMQLHMQARLKRDLDEVSGEHITYNSKTEIFQVKGGSPGNEEVMPKRVRAVLQPKSKSETTLPGTTPAATENNTISIEKHE